MAEINVRANCCLAITHDEKALELIRLIKNLRFFINSQFLSLTMLCQTAILTRLTRLVPAARLDRYNGPIQTYPITSQIGQI